MRRLMALAGLAVLMLSIYSAYGSPVRGQYRAGELQRLDAGRNLELRETFRANERACVIVEGDHRPVMNLKIQVRDSAGNAVAADLAGGDFLVVTWYPPRTQEYTLSITSDGKEYNDLMIVMK